MRVREVRAKLADLEREHEWEAARERFKFEGWANRRRAELQSRQLDERGELGRRHGRQRENLEDELAATYGAGKREAQAKLVALERREAEQRGQLARVQEVEKTALAAGHRRQDRVLEDRIREAYERREQEGWQPLPSREVANDRPRRKLPTWEEMQRQRQRAELRERERDRDRGRDWRRDRDFDRER